MVLNQAQQYAPGMLGGAVPQNPPLGQMGFAQSMNPPQMIPGQMDPAMVAQMRAQQQQKIQADMAALRAQNSQSFWKQPGYQQQEQARMSSNAQAMQQYAAAERANGYVPNMPLNTPTWRTETAEGRQWAAANPGATAAERAANRPSGRGDYRSWMNAGLLGGNGRGY